MKETLIAMAVFIFGVMLIVSIPLSIQVYEDAYCRNTPWDRLDYERCGINKE